MPGYTMHLAEASMLLPELKKIYQVDDRWKNHFLIGILLPDTKIRTDKKDTHFWNPDDLNKLARAPELSRFYKKYGSRLEEPMMLGYWAHLYLDERFVHEFWPNMIRFCNQNGEETELMADIDHVTICRTGEEVPVSRFYSVDYYYGDYNRMNRYFFEKYPIEFPYYDETLDPDMEEIQISHMHRILNELDLLAGGKITAPGLENRVFDTEAFDRFIQKNASEFLQLLDQRRNI